MHLLHFAICILIIYNNSQCIMLKNIASPRNENIHLRKLSNSSYLYNDQDTPNSDTEYSMQNPYKDFEDLHEGDEDIIDDELVLTKILINGSDNEVKTFKRTDIIKQLLNINKIKLSLNQKLIIWEIVKGNNSLSSFTRPSLERFGNLFLSIPETDLFSLNYSNWDIVDYLGTLPDLGRRRTGVAGFALKLKYGNEIFSNASYINRLKGLICAFAPRDLLKISTETFLRINQSVFENIRSCTRRQQQVQLRVLLQIAKQSTAYGPPQSWSNEVTTILGLLLKAMNIDDLKTIRPSAMEGIHYQTIDLMKNEQLQVLSPGQISFLTDLSLSSYRRKTGISSNSFARRYNRELIYSQNCFLIIIHFLITVA